MTEDEGLGLPEWFVSDERLHRHRQLPVTGEQVEYYRQRMRALSARPIKKVIEARARRKQKVFCLEILLLIRLLF